MTIKLYNSETVLVNCEYERRGSYFSFLGPVRLSHYHRRPPGIKLATTERGDERGEERETTDRDEIKFPVSRIFLRIFCPPPDQTQNCIFL